MLLGTLEFACFYWAVGHLPLADTMAYWMAAPIFVVALSALLLREHVDAKRWLCVVAGFLGVAVALGGDLEAAGWPALVALAGSLLYALSWSDAAPAGDAGTWCWRPSDAGRPGGRAGDAARQGWVTPTLTDLALLLMLGLVATLGHMGTTRALKLAPASVVVPYQYSYHHLGRAVRLAVLRRGAGADHAGGVAVVVVAGLWLGFRDGGRARMSAGRAAIDGLPRQLLRGVS